jgi:hypothetical protein
MLAFAVAKPSPEKQQFNIYLPPDLVRRIKHHAIDRGESLSRLVERIFDEYLARVEAPDSGRRTAPSAATKGRRP